MLANTLKRDLFIFCCVDFERPDCSFMLQISRINALPFGIVTGKSYWENDFVLASTCLRYFSRLCLRFLVET